MLAALAAQNNSVAAATGAGAGSGIVEGEAALVDLSQVTTLRVKLQAGKKALILKMQYSDTIGAPRLLSSMRIIILCLRSDPPTGVQVSC